MAASTTGSFVTDIPGLRLGSRTTSIPTKSLPPKRGGPEARGIMPRNQVLLRRRARARCGTGSRLIETVPQHVDFDPVAAAALRRGFPFPDHRSIAHAHRVDAVGWNIMIQY